MSKESNRIVILQISDLHITDDTNKKSYLKSDVFSEYIDTFINGISTSLGSDSNKIFLIVTGDIADASIRLEYEQAAVVLNKLCERLSIIPKDVMLLPGNHDINRNLLKVESDKGTPDNELHTKQKVKFKFFKEFYDKFYMNKDIKFNPGKSVVRTILLPENNLLLIGVNTVYHESILVQDHKGWIEPTKLREELSIIKQSTTDYSTLYKIVFMHHRPDRVNESNNHIANWSHVGPIFEEFGIYNYVSGHNHSYQSYPLHLHTTQIHAGCGTFGLIADKQHNSILLLKSDEVIQQEGIYKFVVEVYKLQNDSTLFWQHITGNPDISPDFIVSKRTLPSPPATTTIINTSTSNYYDERPNIQDTPLHSCDETTDKELKALVKNNNLFYTGHFHWGKDSRAHGWIDIGSMINKSKVVTDIVRYYKLIIDKADIYNDLGTLIGLGMEGNIIGARLSLALNTPYTYYPYSNSMHSKYEKELSTFASKTISIIDLVYYQGDAVKRFIEECKESLKGIEKINVLCLFHTGKPSNYIIPDARCKIIPVCTSIKQCPCNEADVNDCSVYVHKLAPIHEFTMNNNN